MQAAVGKLMLLLWSPLFSTSLTVVSITTPIIHNPFHMHVQQGFTNIAGDPDPLLLPKL